MGKIPSKHGFFKDFFKPLQFVFQFSPLWITFCYHFVIFKNEIRYFWPILVAVTDSKGEYVHILAYVYIVMCFWQ